ncbi:uncharacterized protein AC631_01653 [Debaryomyces fabryi]|uniref:Ribonuclease H n=1 Tax=Debaryomyces fabryi TaxID=58627 RepID=A0A0V1Q2L5_9ASCO|nr:uncharacterized protein AC631_01653 [Debaryomyces fabryi]KSA02570.1 hypothetical protein AC631_01653 [Debaryomyces fabryi]CUM55943.1 unnamed protein product [Debaryomyces fabryi]
MPYYAVAKGIKPGIYTSWNVCKQNVSGYKGAVFKKFVSVKQAQQFIESNSSTTPSPQTARSPYGSKLSNSSNYTGTIRTSSARNDFQNIKLEYHESVPHLKVSLGAEYHSRTAKFTSQSNKVEDSDIKIQKIYVDGASRGNGKIRMPISGYGVFYGANDERNGAISLNQIDDVNTNKPTNQRAELFAIKHALIDIANEIIECNEKISTKYEIYSDSQYAQSCITKWCDEWMKNNWKTSQGKPVSNKDIISSVIPILNYINQYYNKHHFGDLQFFHVRGHKGDYGNEMADRLANIGADNMEKELNAE